MNFTLHPEEVDCQSKTDAPAPSCSEGGSLSALFSCIDLLDKSGRPFDFSSTIFRP